PFGQDVGGLLGSQCATTNDQFAGNVVFPQPCAEMEGVFDTRLRQLARAVVLAGFFLASLGVAHEEERFWHANRIFFEGVKGRKGWTCFKNKSLSSQF